RTRRLPGQVVQQNGLAYPRVTPHHQRPAVASPDRLDEPPKRVALAEPVPQPRRAAPSPGIRGHRPGVTPRPGRLAGHERSHGLPAASDCRPDEANPAATSTSRCHPRRLPLKAKPGTCQGHGHQPWPARVAPLPWPKRNLQDGTGKPPQDTRQRKRPDSPAASGLLWRSRWPGLAHAVSSLRAPGNPARVSKTSNPSGSGTVATGTGPVGAEQVTRRAAPGRQREPGLPPAEPAFTPASQGERPVAWPTAVSPKRTDASGRAHNRRICRILRDQSII